jgi:hypothetical protein
MPTVNAGCIARGSTTSDQSFLNVIYAGNEPSRQMSKGNVYFTVVRLGKEREEKMPWLVKRGGLLPYCELDSWSALSLCLASSLFFVVVTLSITRES